MRLGEKTSLIFIFIMIFITVNIFITVIIIAIIITSENAINWENFNGCYLYYHFISVNIFIGPRSDHPCQQLTLADLDTQSNLDAYIGKFAEYAEYVDYAEYAEYAG